MMIDGCSDIVYCENCGKIIPYDDSILHTRLACAKPDSHLRIRGPTSHKVLQTCRQMYQEARGILASSLKVYFDIQSGWTRSVLLRILLDHQFLRFATPYVRHIYTTMRKKSQAGQLPLLFTNVECLEFGPGLGCWRQMILSTEEVCSGKDEENLLRWADGEVKRWTEDSEFHIKPGNSISWHLNIGGQLRDGLFCAIKYDIENRTILERRISTVSEVNVDIFVWGGEPRHEVNAWDVILEKTRAGWDEAWA